MAKNKSLKVYLTEKSGHLIDFSRIAELVGTNHKYTFSQALPRLFIAATSFGCIILGYNRDSCVMSIRIPHSDN
jgi:hypothetical protein